MINDVLTDAEVFRLVTGLVLSDDTEIVTKQLPIDDESKAKLIDVRQGLFNEDVSKLASELYNGDITLGQWEESMKRYIRELHTSVAAIQKGGWDAMTPADWGRLGNPLKEQYRYLHGFAQYIADNRDTISLQMIEGRSRLYGDAARATANLVVAGDVIGKNLPWLPGDMTTECGPHCKCRWELGIISSTKEFNMVQAVWKLSEAEHCKTCVKRDNHVVTFPVHKTITIPPYIGKFAESSL